MKEILSMEFRVNYKGKNKKELIAAIEVLTGKKAVYMKVPSCAYKIGHYQVRRFGTMMVEDTAKDSEIELLIERLAERGFEIELFKGRGEKVEQNVEEAPQAPQQPLEPEIKQEAEPEQEEDRLTIELPAFTVNTKAIENLNRIIESKGNLFKKAFKTDSLDYTTLLTQRR